MNTVNAEIKKVVGKVKGAQAQLQSLVKDQDWVGEAKKYAKRQGKEVQKILGNDVDKVRTFIEKERKELERIQKQIPGEVKKLQKFVMAQKKELEKLLVKFSKGELKTTPKMSSKPTPAAKSPGLSEAKIVKAKTGKPKKKKANSVSSGVQT